MFLWLQEETFEQMLFGHTLLRFPPKKCFGCFMHIGGEIFKNVGGEATLFILFFDMIRE